ncbi:hypothetical protein BCV63_13795 [Cylindrospermopsis raciborskii CS-508]|uniref:hypothetical protein n=1 Tax=Cylindrospermopsis raciborskii TaxID=77022 RepID=UPI0008DC77FB|nr:hypothetical protein [Cylindrospermopsis raciborskii]OHY37831.1 hypothetical protein BCV63_13795 [Cylindrospermopsis raciborskii CS-508]BAZ89977.1 hypothetical protein NIES932_14620 [Raphidiopsis curvata NIES-932]
MLRLLIYSVTSGFLVLLNTGIVDLANAQETSGRYVKTFVGNQSVTIDCIDETYDKKGDGSVWISVYDYHQRYSTLRKIIQSEYVRLCGRMLNSDSIRAGLNQERQRKAWERRFQKERQREREFQREQQRQQKREQRFQKEQQRERRRKRKF